mgnify:FL=1
MKLGKINRLSIVDSSFTSILTTIAPPPKALYYIGALPEKRPTVAIVGSRRPTPYGIEVTRQLAYDLAKAGITVISGLAYGIDAVAHKAALDAGGTTIAVLANGLHRVYPTAHIGLARDIIQKGGALISEMPPGEDARAYHFLARNRIISGLADAVVVTEATDRSGTFSTATHALTQNKELFAVPGPITSLLSVGANKLLKQGAHPVTSAQDILERIAPSYIVAASEPLSDTPEEHLIITLLKKGVRKGDELQQQSMLSPQVYLQTLTMLEIKGIVRPLGGDRWSL